MATNLSTPIGQAAALPFRWQAGAPRFCLITSSQKGHWAFPKGMIDPGETSEETALKEANEEAGLLGEIVGEPLGNYAYCKWGLNLEVTLHLMHVTEYLEEWQESAVRLRRWVSAAEALRIIDRAELRRFLRIALARLDANRQPA